MTRREHRTFGPLHWKTKRETVVSNCSPIGCWVLHQRWLVCMWCWGKDDRCNPHSASCLMSLCLLHWTWHSMALCFKGVDYHLIQNVSQHFLCIYIYIYTYKASHCAIQLFILSFTEWYNLTPAPIKGTKWTNTITQSILLLLLHHEKHDCTLTL